MASTTTATPVIVLSRTEFPVQSPGDEEPVQTWAAGNAVMFNNQVDGLSNLTNGRALKEISRNCDPRSLAVVLTTAAAGPAIATRPRSPG
jgi:hypothetical protein